MGENLHDFDGFLSDYMVFNSVRKMKRNAPKGSGGVAVFVHEHLLKHFQIRRKYQDLLDSITLHYICT